MPFIKLRVTQWLKRREHRELVEEMDTTQRIQLLAAGATIDDADTQDLVEELRMPPYRSTVEDYGEVVIQHGFLVMFGLAFPLAALINFLNNMAECRTDTYKMLAVHQRPDADDAADIGGWFPFLKFLSTASIVTTAALVTITTPAIQLALPDFIGNVGERYPAVSFLIFEHVLLLTRWVVDFLVSDKPSSTYRRLARQEFLIAKCFNVGMQPYFESSAHGIKEA
ncbi:unnamed protein product [Chondrus crispus]|uniref:Anoctamin transmembrane domain-containing protein n=1 Tax=Chondrus crispus TaxID=2769 RepID=R7Q4C3_CHOCR|nr:unnamed protein product [Chondrus crispus]CDF33372.1 unnamed protein product [Chondrus crispus]|eukprot:XP_005713175.1 unnamed protein product [Chondrus crispus]